MNLLFRKNLSKTFSFLHRIQLSNFGRNAKMTPFKFAEIPNPKHMKASNTTLQSKTSGNEKEVISDLKERSQRTNSYDQENLTESQILQLEILRTQTMKNACDLYKEKRDQMNIINVCTCLNRAVTLGLKQNKGKEAVAKQIEIKEMIDYLRVNIDEMGDFTIANYLSNLAKLDILDREIVDKIVQKSIQNNIQFNEKSLSFITRALAKFNIKNQPFLDLVAKRITKPDCNFRPKSLCFIFWAMSELNYKNKDVIEMMNKFVVTSSDRLDSIDVQHIFAAYNNYRLSNWDVLDTLSQHIIKNCQKLSFRNLANITNFCANLNYVNATLFDHLEREFIKRLKTTPEFQSILNDSEGEFDLHSEDEQAQNEDSGDNSKSLNQKEKSQETSSEKNEVQQTTETEGLNKSLNLFDVTQILVSFSKLKVIKSELFELLELHFIKNLDKATAGSIVSYAFAHSALCNEMFQKYQENKQIFRKRSVKNLKKYNNTFYEVLIPFMQMKTPEFTPDEAFSVLVSASRPLLTKRVLRKGVLEFGVMNIPKMEALRNSLSTLEFEKFIYKYNLMLQKFVDKKEQLIMISQCFSEINVNIGLIDKAYNQILMEGDNSKFSWQEKDETFFEDEEEEEIEKIDIPAGSAENNKGSN